MFSTSSPLLFYSAPPTFMILKILLVCTSLCILGSWGMCTTQSVYEECKTMGSCDEALWSPSMEQFVGLVARVPLDCSSPSPALDLAARVRTKYVCNAGEYAFLDDGGALTCTCPPNQTCTAPENDTVISSLVIIVLMALIVGITFKNRFRPR